MWKLRFRKLYAEAKDGVVVHAIIQHHQRPYERRIDGPDVLHETRHYRVRYEHVYLVDLWFTIIEIHQIDSTWEDE